MKILGIIAEYNPFHSGHMYHLNKSKELTGADAVIAVMSGDFVQRGEPAIADKWARAEMAVKNGADLVIELPFAYALNSADYFAKGGVRILDSLGCVDYISFGSESGEIETLSRIADILNCESDEFKSALKEALGRGLSYPQARAEAVEAALQSKELICSDGKAIAKALKQPNNILAIEYLRQLKQIDSKMQPVTIQRIGQAYNDSDFESIEKGSSGGSINDDEAIYASATAIRARLQENVDISTLIRILSPETIGVLKGINCGVKSKLNDYLFELLRYEIIKHSSDELAEIFAVSEGIENKLKSAARKAGTLEELIKAIISKRYTRTRISRMLIQLLVDLKQDDFIAIDSSLDSSPSKYAGLLSADASGESPLYARILAFSDKGASIIKQLKKSEACTIPLITNINKEAQNLGETATRLLEYDIKAADIYNLISGYDIYDFSDHVRTPYISHK